MPRVETPMRGVRIWKNKFGMTVIRLHYSADPEKDEAWARKQRESMTDEGMYLQEYEIDFGATQGQLIFHMDDEATLEESFNVPHSWTRYYALDPHPAKPHASLWGAVDPYGDLWIYREYWPSKIYGKRGNVPADDNRITIREYVNCLKFLESAENVQNGGMPEKIYERTIDYAARAFGKGTSDDRQQPNFQQRFEAAGDELEFPLYFADAKKDHDVGFEVVNEWLKPRMVDDGKNGFVKKSRLRIMRDRCPELVYQLKHNRTKALTTAQAENEDPSLRPLKKRNDLTDDLRYLLMAEPEFVPQFNDTERESSWKPIAQGIAY